MNYVSGFAHINKDATSCKGALKPEDFIGKTCPVVEFNSEGDVLVLNPKGTALAMFDKADVYRSFKCSYINGVVCPPDLDMMGQMAYVAKTMSRKGGYDNLLLNMVIEASLMKGQFYDDFLWAKQ